MINLLMRRMNVGKRQVPARLWVLTVGDSITSGGGYPVHVLSEDTRRTEARSLMLALDADDNGQVRCRNLCVWCVCVVSNACLFCMRVFMSLSHTRVYIYIVRCISHHACATSDAHSVDELKC